MGWSQNNRGMYGNRKPIINYFLFTEKQSQNNVLSNQHCYKSQYWVDFIPNIYRFFLQIQLSIYINNLSVCNFLLAIIGRLLDCLETKILKL